MSLEAILEEIRKAGEDELAEIEDEVQEQEQAILDEAEAEAERQREEILEKATREAENERRHILERARLEALHIEAEARRALIEETLEAARLRLQELRDGDDYMEALRRLAQEGSAEIHKSIGPDDRVLLRLDPRDEQRFQGVLTNLDGNLETTYDLDTWGGLTAASADGRVVVYNTFEARLERAMHYLRRTLAAIYT